MIRIQNTLINKKEILYIEKYGFYEIRVTLKDKDIDILVFVYEDTERRDVAFKNIYQFGRG